MGFELYLVTDGWDGATAGVVERALGGAAPGRVAVQLRAKRLDARALLDAARVLAAVCARHGAPLYLNDRADVAAAVGAAGVHLPSSGLDARAVRRVCPALAIGASTHTLAEARAAAEAGADFVVFGPVWAVPGPGKAPPVGVEELARAVAAVPVPVFALGGVTPASAPLCRAAGARVACMRAVAAAPDPAAAVAALLPSFDACHSPPTCL